MNFSQPSVSVELVSLESEDAMRLVKEYSKIGDKNTKALVCHKTVQNFRLINVYLSIYAL